jgi:hypothetical protein
VSGSGTKENDSDSDNPEIPVPLMFTLYCQFCQAPQPTCGGSGGGFQLIRPFGFGFSPSMAKFEVSCDHDELKDFYCI